MRAAGLAGLAGLPLPSCNRYQRRSWPFKSSNHPTDCFHRASNVSMKFKGRKVPKISIDHLTNQGFWDAVAATCHNLISPYGDGAQTSKGFEPPKTIHWCPEIYPRHPMAASTKPTQTTSHQFMQRRAASGPSASELVRLHHHGVICQDASRNMHIFEVTEDWWHNGGTSWLYSIFQASYMDIDMLCKLCMYFTQPHP